MYSYSYIRKSKSKDSNEKTSQNIWKEIREHGSNVDTALSKRVEKITFVSRTREY